MQSAHPHTSLQRPETSATFGASTLFPRVEGPKLPQKDVPPEEPAEAGSEPGRVPYSYSGELESGVAESVELVTHDTKPMNGKGLKTRKEGARLGASDI